MGSTLCEIITSSIPNSPSLHSNCRDLSSTLSTNIITAFDFVKGARGSVVVKALCYKPEGRGFDSR
jgi:hypothetical protein